MLNIWNCYERTESIKKVENGKIVIDFPDGLEGMGLKVQVSIISRQDDNQIDYGQLPAQERIKILEQFFGKNKFPETVVSKYDVYKQQR